MTLEQEVKTIVAEALGVPVEKLGEDSCVGDFPEWNSLGHMLAVTAIEKHFSVSLDSEKIMELESVSDFAEAVRAARGSC